MIARGFFCVLVAAGITLSASVAAAQIRADCASARPPAVGVAFGRSSAYFEPSVMSPRTEPGSVSSGGGLLFAGRADVAIARAWRARIEGTITEWRLRQQLYSQDLRQVIGSQLVGEIGVGNIVGFVGRQVGQPPLCAYVLAGVGEYWLNYQGVRHRHPGFALDFGVEFPVGAHGAVQGDWQLHLVNTTNTYPIGSSTVIDNRLLIGWVYRF